MPTLKDIMDELAKPGRDPRSKIKEFSFADVHSMEDLIPGMVVPGIVTNITKFGAFVDIGIKQDGLVHVSNLSKNYTTDPSKVVKLHQHVMVKVLAVDIERKRIQLSMKDVDVKKHNKILMLHCTFIYLYSTIFILLYSFLSAVPGFLLPVFREVLNSSLRHYRQMKQ